MTVPMPLTLHSFALSSASWRLRIGLTLKGLAFDILDVSLFDGAHKQAEFARVNPNQRVPALVLGDGTVLTQSMAILAWLDEVQPDPPLLPVDFIERAQCRAFAALIVEDIFPVQNLGVRQKLAAEFGADAARQAQWSADWILRGFGPLEAMLVARGWQPGSGWLFGQRPSLAEICLVPQMRNAVRYGCDLTGFPRLVAANAMALEHPAFSGTATHPE